MNSIILKPTGNLEINGAEIGQLSGFRIKTDSDGLMTATVQFCVHKMDVEVSAEDFVINNLPLKSTQTSQLL